MYIIISLRIKYHVTPSLSMCLLCSYVYLLLLFADLIFGYLLNYNNINVRKHVSMKNVFNIYFLVHPSFFLLFLNIDFLFCALMHFISLCSFSLGKMKKISFQIEFFSVFLQFFFFSCGIFLHTKTYKILI